MSLPTTESPSLSRQDNLTLAKPHSEDGSAVFDLIARCSPLDQNSMYCNLLQCSHFRDTSVVAKSGGTPVGFISGYRIPDRPDTLFVWQVAVDSSARGMGLASRMLRHLIDQVGQVEYLHTSITASNEASWRTFQRLARDLDAPMKEDVMFDYDRHFDGRHDTEALVMIGPIPHTPQQSI
ncbi:diaminobutyrate acetyltransferase [Bacterioplanes sanyensis]|uniref:L-2,4-diaminobutyric acid acetyltransferase n=1 Tax=Bacterioplanes sanyensis TaxID=1249553 RepID=A0A222FFN5_9GAMM|nr:diaminobutyrate acetyltransferase [Bacterioplanes sanyensis]ASP37580.1 diaminobutyrate acetyltransferase [Bacterioplanes sanyensis]